MQTEAIPTPSIPKMTERQITIVKAGNFDEQMRNDMKAMYSAIGYLSNWASPESFPKVRLACVGDIGSRTGVEITAYYTQPDGQVGFVIGAIWHSNTREFSFHS